MSEAIYTIGGKAWTSLKSSLITKQGHVSGKLSDGAGQQCGVDAWEKLRILHSATGSLHPPCPVHQMWGAQRKFAVGSRSI